MKYLIWPVWLITGIIIFSAYMLKKGIDFMMGPIAVCYLWCASYLGLDDEPAQNTTNRK